VVILIPDVVVSRFGTEKRRVSVIIRRLVVHCLSLSMIRVADLVGPGLEKKCHIQ
jgi:hypothetical protein